MEQEISGISKFPEKKGQPREMDLNFRNEFPELPVPFDFESEFSKNFGRVERAPRQT